MKKLLQATSALVLIIMSSQAFATDEQIELGLFRAGLAQPVISVSTDKNSNDDLKELALYCQNLTAEQVKNSMDAYRLTISNLTPVVEPMPVVTPSVVSTPVPEPTIEEVVQEVAQKTLRSLISLKDPNLPYYNEFRQTFIEYLKRAPCEKKEYAFPHFINKFFEARLYNFTTYFQWQRAENSYKTNQAEKSLASTDVQRNAFLSYMYKVMNEKYNIEIDEFKAIGSNDARPLEEIVQSTFNPEVRLNTPQNITNDARNGWGSLFK